MTETQWIDDEAEIDFSEQAGSLKEYDISAIPNDFNVKTIFDLIDSGSVKIPGFQRNYVWDIKRASKLIESIIIGLPIPQIFLYQEGRNKFLVIDGQQRLMSIYYFIKRRFPRKEKLVQIRRIFDENGSIPAAVLEDDQFFLKFNLNLPPQTNDRPNPFDKLNYDTLGEYKSSFDFRPIRNVIIKQNFPDDDDSSVYEIFNRLNSGGVTLTPQEIRASLYHSKFYDMLNRANCLPEWRRILGISEPDLHLKDLEVLLRGFAMLVKGHSYSPSMTRFLNQFSKDSRKFTQQDIDYFSALFGSFLASAARLQPEDFFSKTNRRFNLSLFEAVFYAVCCQAYGSRAFITAQIRPDKMALLRNDEQFIDAIQSKTASAANVKTRLARAKNILVG